MTDRIVVIEDIKELGELMQLMLSHPTLDVHHATNGEDGLALIHSLKPDLIILDIMLPGGIDGWTVYDTVRADSRYDATAIVMLSVLRQNNDRREQFETRANDVYITKPFDAEPLRHTIAGLLRRPALWPLRDDDTTPDPPPA